MSGENVYVVVEESDKHTGLGYIQIPIAAYTNEPTAKIVSQGDNREYYRVPLKSRIGTE